jgi:polyhydroxyalkanoate synthesis regulator protein
MNQKRVLKKYPNRKLYDVKTSSYVTYSDLINYIKANEDVIVLDNVTKNDITVQTLHFAKYRLESKQTGDNVLSELVSSIKGL